MKVVAADQIEPGMILYSVPEEPFGSNAYEHRVFVMEYDGRLILVPAVLSGAIPFNVLTFAIRKQEVYTSWETALIAAKKQNSVEMTKLQLKENQLQVLIDNERSR